MPSTARVAGQESVHALDEIYKGCTTMTNDPTLEYFEEYRNKISAMAELHTEMDLLKNRIDELRKNSASLSREIEGMRRIITVMIDQGMDPVEAKLRTDPSDRMDSMWDWKDHIVTNTGTIGATGSMSMATTTIAGAASSSGVYSIVTGGSVPPYVSHGTAHITNGGYTMLTGQQHARSSTGVTGS